MAIDVSRLQGGAAVQPTASVQQPVSSSLAGVGSALKGVADIVEKVGEDRAKQQRTSAIKGSLDALLDQAEAVGGDDFNAESRAAAEEAAERKGKLEKAQAQGSMSPAALARRRIQLLRDTVAKYPGQEDVIMNVFAQQEGKLKPIYSAATADYVRQKEMEAQFETSAHSAAQSMGRSDELAGMTFDEKLDWYQTEVNEPMERSRERERKALEDESEGAARTAKAEKAVRELIRDDGVAGVIGVTEVLSGTGDVGEKISRLKDLRASASQALRNQVGKYDPAVQKKHEDLVLRPYDNAISRLQRNEEVSAIQNGVKLDHAAIEAAISEATGGASDRVRVAQDILGELVNNQVIADQMATSMGPVVASMMDADLSNIRFSWEEDPTRSPANPAKGTPKVSGTDTSRQNRDAIEQGLAPLSDQLSRLYTANRTQATEKFSSSVMDSLGEAARRPAVLNNPAAFRNLTKTVADPRFLKAAEMANDVDPESYDRITEVLGKYSMGLVNRMQQNFSLVAGRDFSMEWNEDSNKVVMGNDNELRGRGQQQRRKAAATFVSRYNEQIRAASHLAGHTNYQQTHEAYAGALRERGLIQ